MPKVSVVIPTYNFGRFLGEAIQSVLDQTFEDFEVIVVDDGSTDNTKEVVNGFADPRVKYIYQENRGACAAYNRGVLASGGEYIAFLDADDLWLPHKLEVQVKVLDSRLDVALVCSDTYLFDDQTGVILGRYWHDDKQFHGWFNPQKASRYVLKYLLLRGTFIIETTTMLRASVFTEVGYFDESLRNFTDWDMFLRVAQRFAIEAIDMPLSKNRRHGANLSGNLEQMYESEQIVLNKAIRSYSLQPDEIRLVKRRLARLHFLYGSRSVVNGEIMLGRKRLLASIRINPWYIKTYMYLGESLLGSRLVLAYKSWKQWLKRCLVRLRLSGGATSTGDAISAARINGEHWGSDRYDGA